MRQQEPSVATLPTPGRETPAPARPLWRPRWRAVGVAVITTVGAVALAVMGSAERDAYLRAHPAVPDLVGKTVADAARMMVPLHFGIIVTGSIQDPNARVGVVLIQNPPPGRLLPMGSIIQLKVSQGSGLVPRLRGDPVSAAAQRLESVGLRLGRVHDVEDGAPPGTVLEQYTPPGHRIDANSPVDVLVSDGPHQDASIAALTAAPYGAARLRATAPQETRAVMSTAAPLAVPMWIDLAPGTLVPAPDEHRTITPQRGQEGGTRGGSASTDCAAYSERKRAEVCRQPADDRGPQPDLHGPEHRLVPIGP
jgi:hypothetical protein